MTRKALTMAGGIETMVNPGESVFIKVNMMTVGMVPGNSIVRGESTKPEIAMTLAEECLRAGASSVVVGDAAQRNHFSWESVPSLNGDTHYALEAARLTEHYGPRIHLACLMGDSPDWVEVPSPFTNLSTLKIARVAMEADRLFSVAVFKTHMTTKITGALKNCFGLTPAESIGVGAIKSRLNFHAATGGVHQVLLDIIQAVRPDFSLVDLSICVEGSGPANSYGLSSRTVDMRDHIGDYVLVASADPVAADATASRIIMHDPEQIRHLRLAWEQGLGQIHEDKIDIIGEPIPTLTAPWQPAALGAKLLIPEEWRHLPPYCCPDSGDAS